MPHSRHEVDVWAVEGRFQHLVYSPKGAIEGFLIDTDGVPTQFVVDPHEPTTGQALMALRPGDALVVEGIEAGPSPKGEADHTVYHFERLATIGGKPGSNTAEPTRVTGRVARFNHARHGEPNGVVLDTGDFVHLRPDGFHRAGLKIGDRVTAEGRASRLVTGDGWVVEAHTIHDGPTGAGAV